MESMIEKLYDLFLKYPEVTTDSRNIPKDSIFFALKGDNFNGNDYALDALQKGAVLAVVDEGDVITDDRVILVNNVLETLQNLATYHRNQLGIKVIGITGTNGKTTTKELIQVILKKKYNSFATKGNFNNHIGVPLTLLSLTREHEIAIVEMGANHVGEIDDLCKIALPDFGIITNIGKAHLEGFGGFEGVIKTKTELYKHIRISGGSVFINTDNQLLVKFSDGINSITYGESKPAECRGEITDDFPFVQLMCAVKGEAFPVQSKLIGRYNFENILAAICIGNYFKVSFSDMQNAIAAYKPINNRSQIIETKSNTIILDAYNANPSSMKVAIENFTIAKFEKKVLVLGDMAELGMESDDEHTSILKLVKSNNFNNVILVGPEFKKANQSFGFSAVLDKDRLEVYLKERNFENATILIKGSRKMELEKITHLL